MNKTVELVNQWAAFEEKHPDGSIEDFCRYQLIHRRENESSKPLVGGVVPRITDGLLLKIMARIHKLHMIYSDMALEGSGVNQMEEFGMLMQISQDKDPRKTDVIYSHLMELSSGTDMLNRLKNRGLVTEQPDPEDKRAKRLHLTKAGEKVIEACKPRVAKLAKMMLFDVAEDDKLLCIRLLKGVEQKFSEIMPAHKGRDFAEVFDEVVGKEEVEKKKRGRKK
jgi:DNA-binding MarR family transcriptional regulator